MQTNRQPVRSLAMAGLPLLLCLLLVQGCRLFTPEPQSLAYQHLPDTLSDLRSINDGLETFSGTGAVILRQDGQIARYRFAWACRLPDKIRLVVLVAGRPVETVAYNGRILTLRSETGAHGYIKKETDNPDLEALIQVPLKIKDVITILSGRVPVMAHQYLSRTKKAESESTEVTLETRDHTVIETISINQHGRPVWFKIFDNHSDPIYQVAYERFKTYQQFIIPVLIQIRAANGNQCTFHIDSFFPQSTVGEDVFIVSDH